MKKHAIAVMMIAVFSESVYAGVYLIYSGRLS
ncbi:outer membrane protease [Salmonella enterica subsp. enterica serovar Daytona]|uniref:Outer membrane protease n=1 Tax=Salmonella enterica subsp. enterica serovar Daytona TaxID=1962639 RepID=A0A447JEY9_SALET|nr:outer membrane protease [Salmonella enterica subsp. enterica serovar Daytona]